MAKKHSSNRPSVMLSMFSPLPSRKTSLAQISRATDERIQRGISRFSVLRVMAIGAKRAVQPTITRVLNVLLPTTLPMAMSALPFRAEDMLTVSSGAEVPKATMVSPMTMDGIWKRLATDVAPSVSPLAPRRMRSSPPTRNNISIGMLILSTKIMQTGYRTFMFA